MKLGLIFPLSLVASLSFSLFAAGCAANNGDTETEEDLVASEESELSTGANFGYFQFVRRDTRRCASPLCGGLFVKRVNEAKTTCADGSRQAECYVASVQFGGTSLSTREEGELREAFENGRALIKARTYKTFSRGSTLGVLKATEGWIASTGATFAALDGASFFRVADNGRRCIVAPCPSTTAFGLNGAHDYDVVDVLLETIGATEPTLDRARNAIGTSEGVIIGGAVRLPKCKPGSNCGPTLAPTEIYTRVLATEGKACGGRSAARTQCNDDQTCFWEAGATCGRTDASGTCGYKPQICTRIYAPVCGCDGASYGNACEARAAGTSVASNGDCL